MNGEERRTSPWVYVAVGCSIPVLLIVVLLGAVVFWGRSLQKHIESDTPEVRAEKVKQVLGCQEIPEGYHAMMTLSIPFLMDLAILSDKPPDFKNGKNRQAKPFDQRGFIYVKAIRGRKGKSVQDYINGEADSSEILGRGKIRAGDLEPIRRGSFPLGDMTVHYSANRGSLSAQGYPMKGIVTFVYLECPGDKRLRMGIWFGPESAADKPGQPPDYAGTPADESEIRSFLSHFSPCSR